MFSWLAKGRLAQGWFVASVAADELTYAHRHHDTTGKSLITAYGARRIEGEKQGLQKLAHEMRLGQYQCAALLNQGEYQVLQVEAPSVPGDELKSAIRWRIKDMIDFHVDDAAIDVLDVPPDEKGGNRAHLMYAVAARNDVIQACVRQFDEARVPLSVIDIRETAQRNIATLFETAERGVALVYFAQDWGLLTINYRGELYLARRLDLGMKQLAADSAAQEGGALERVAVEIQRTLDHFERQFRSIPVARVLVAPLPSDVGLGEFLRARLGMESSQIDLNEVLGFDEPGGPDAETQWRFFHHFGAALRHETKAL
jgi:MSHA biogenesis protein MshI